MKTLDEILAQYKEGKVNLADARAQIEAQFFVDIGHSNVDLDRLRRTGAGEVIYGEFKSADQISEKIIALAEHGQDVLVTRVSPEKYGEMSNLDSARLFPDISYHEEASLITHKQSNNALRKSSIAVVTAGTSDQGVAEEAALTAEFFDNPVLRISDVGVAGIHRLLARVEDIRKARVVIVVAGMEGALPSVVSGLIDKPVIAVPTSVGYGASFQGVAALLGMLNSCAAGVSVVNIDNGFGAGFLASKINAL